MAKRLCAMLITRALNDLNEDEEEIVVDYLEKNLKIEVPLNMKTKDMCLTLLEKTMIKELNKKVPITAYSNSILSSNDDNKIKTSTVDTIKEKRISTQKNLENSKLPGCIPSNSPLNKTLYDLIVNPNIGIVKLQDDTSQYSAVVSVSQELYYSIFLTESNPILEINSSKGIKTFARISDEVHNEDNSRVYISPLVGTMLNISDVGAAFLKLCSSLPEIKKVNFTYYGSNEDLQKILPILISKVPSVINAFSYLSLGMILLTDIEGKEVQLRVDELIDIDENPIFAGIIRFGENDLPFDIEADL